MTELAFAATSALQLYIPEHESPNLLSKRSDVTYPKQFIAMDHSFTPSGVIEAEAGQGSSSSLWLPLHTCEQILTFAANVMSSLNNPPCAPSISALIVVLNPPTTAMRRILLSFLMRHALHICTIGDVDSLRLIRLLKSRLNSLGFRVALIKNQVKVLEWWMSTARWDIAQTSFLSDLRLPTLQGISLEYPMRQAAQRGSLDAVCWIINKYRDCDEDDDVYDFCRTGGGSLSDASVADLLKQGGEAIKTALLCLDSQYPILPASDQAPCQVCMTATQLGMVDVLRLYRAGWPTRACWSSAKHEADWRDTVMSTAVQTGNVEIVQFWVEAMMCESWDPALWQKVGQWAQGALDAAQAIEAWWKDPSSVEWGRAISREQ